MVELRETKAQKAEEDQVVNVEIEQEQEEKRVLITEDDKEEEYRNELIIAEDHDEFEEDQGGLGFLSTGVEQEM
ncbi:hypothetical protein M0R45_031781 [Rubus argutus]|uniref:Uncharacterized protein n=1 Tax=Rubus argutus TaxID=59490 RepID=A0AAW1WGU4_RUBAR